jgi:hypothetical protein
MVVAPGVGTEDYINIKRTRRNGNMNDIQDKQYLALELTKIKHQSITDETDRRDIMEDYWYFLEDLTSIFEKVARVEELEKDNERMRILLSERVEHPDPSIKLHRLIDVINQCKGDMEPYVYECLMAEIQLKIQ